MPVSIPWTTSDRVVLASGLVIALLVRLALLPAAGLRGDIDQFVLWVHGLATAPLSEAYRMDLSFPPVMVYVFAALAAIEPAFRTTTDAADPWIRAVMKTPATLADLGLAFVVVYALRDRPRAAVAAAVSVLVLPAVFYDSAWWGQFESIYSLFGLAACVLAVSGHDRIAVAALAVALMAKPQALPFAVPFVAWFIARHDPRELLRLAAIAAGVIVALWLPFLADGGLWAYARSLAHSQVDLYAFLSLRAWNFWWLVQEAYTGGGFVSDATTVLGPLSARVVGLLLTTLLELVVFFAVLRRPTSRALVLGLAASTLVAFAFLTTMHERYAYAAAVFLLLLAPEAGTRWLWLSLGAVLSLNLVAAVPPTDEIGALIPISGPLGIAGSLGILAITTGTLLSLLRESRSPAEVNAPLSLASG